MFNTLATWHIFSVCPRCRIVDLASQLLHIWSLADPTCSPWCWEEKELGNSGKSAVWMLEPLPISWRLQCCTRPLCPPNWTTAKPQCWNSGWYGICCPSRKKKQMKRSSVTESIRNFKKKKLSCSWLHTALAAGALRWRQSPPHWDQKDCLGFSYG